VEQVAAVRDPRHFELARRDQSIEEPAQRRRPELVPDDPHVGLIASVELAGADPTHRTFHRDRLLLIGKVIDASVQNARELFPLVAWNLAKRAHEGMTVGAASDTKAYATRDVAPHGKQPAPETSGAIASAWLRK
jgi:hypothetical protein